MRMNKYSNLIIHFFNMMTIKSIKTKQISFYFDNEQVRIKIT